MSFNQQLQTFLLYKKYAGYGDSIPATGSYSNELPFNAYQRIYPDIQIWNQYIPPSAPISSMVQDTNFVGGGTRYYSTTYPWIAFYQYATLSNIYHGYSFYSSNTNQSNYATTNILSNAIPSNYDPGLTYQTHVYMSSGGSEIGPSDATYPWNFDPSIGVLTFFPANMNANPGIPFTPVISFWRYEGTFGLSATGSGGGSSTSTGPPPSMSFSNPVITQTNIYIPINYPTQVYTSNYPQPIPTIESSIFNISYTNPNGVNINNQILNTGSIPFDSNYVLPLSTTATGPASNTPLSGIILQNSSASNPVKPTPSLNPFYYYTNPSGLTGLTGPTGVWSIVYNVALSQTGSTGYISGVYTNFSGTGSATGIYFRNFINQSGSTNDARLAMTGAPTNSSITLDILPPTNSNTGAYSGITISGYNGSYYTKGSSLVYGGAVPHGSSGSQIQFSGNTIAYSGANTIYTQNNLYPDCYYQFNIASVNSLNVISANTYSYIGYTGPTPTSYITPLINPSVTNISTATGFFSSPAITGACSVATRNPVTLFNNTNVLTTNIFGPYSLNYDYTTRGILGSTGPGMVITTGIDGKTGPTANLYSFPISGTGSTGSNNMTLTYGPSSDQYTGVTGSASFYSQTSFLISMTGLTGSAGIHTLNIGQKYNYFTSGGAPTGTSYTGSIGFYYDKFSGNPVINSVSASFTGPTGYLSKVSGINIVGQSPTIIVSSNLTNVGTYFYKNPIINYGFSGGCTGTVAEPGLNNVTSSLAGGIFANPVIVRNPSVTPSTSTNWSNNTTLNFVVNNINSSTGTNISLSPSAIFDYPSYSLIANPTTNPTSIQIVYSFLNPQYGCRVWTAPGSLASNANSTGYTGPVEYYSYPPTYGYVYQGVTGSYSNVLYDQSWNITGVNTLTNSIFPSGLSIDASQELQIFNGAYQSISNVGATGGYLNYSSYFGNTLNYSTILKGVNYYRYATFAWKYIGLLTGLNFFNFVFNNFQCNSGPVTLSTKNGCTYITNNGNTQRFFFNYRVEEVILEVPFVNPNGLTTTNTTVWADGNSNLYKTTNVSTPNFGQIGVISNNNYNIPTNNSVMYGSTSTVTFNSNNLNIKVGSIIFKQNSNYYIYGRIGLPMIDNYSFTSVQMYLTNN